MYRKVPLFGDCDFERIVSLFPARLSALCLFSFILKLSLWELAVYLEVSRSLKVYVCLSRSAVWVNTSIQLPHFFLFGFIIWHMILISCWQCNHNVKYSQTFPGVVYLLLEWLSFLCIKLLTASLLPMYELMWPRCHLIQHTILSGSTEIPLTHLSL